MPESRIIPTQTTLSVIGSNITINTKYVDVSQGGVLLAFISEIVGGQSVDSVPFIEGDGGIQMNDDFYPSSLNFSLDQPTGDLIVTAPDSAQYSVDTSTGELVYTF